MKLSKIAGDFARSVADDIFFNVPLRNIKKMIVIAVKNAFIAGYYHGKSEDNWKEFEKQKPSKDGKYLVVYENNAVEFAHWIELSWRPDDAIEEIIQEGKVKLWMKIPMRHKFFRSDDDSDLPF